MSYEPGTCNIGRDETRKRAAMGTVSLLAGVAFLFYALFVADWPATAALGSFPFFFGAAMGFVQAKVRFCAGFGVLGRFDLSGSGGEAGRVDAADALARDRRRALQILGYAAGTGLVATLVAYGLASVLV